MTWPGGGEEKVDVEWGIQEGIPMKMSLEEEWGFLGGRQGIEGHLLCPKESRAVQCVAVTSSSGLERGV